MQAPRANWTTFNTNNKKILKCELHFRFAEDGANFSISTDDPTITGYGLCGDYELANNYFGLTEAHLIKAVSISYTVLEMHIWIMYIYIYIYIYIIFILSNLLLPPHD